MSKRVIHTEVCGERMVKVYDDNQWGEYICELFELKSKTIAGGISTKAWVKHPWASYHSSSRTPSDKEDAIATAVMMVKPLPVSKPDSDSFNFLTSEAA